MLNENTYAIAFRMVPLWSQSRPLAGNHGYTAAVRRPHAMKPLLALLLLFIALAGISAQKPDVSGCVKLVDPNSCPTFTEATMTRKLCTTQTKLAARFLEPRSDISAKGKQMRERAGHATAACSEQDPAMTSGSPVSKFSSGEDDCWDGNNMTRGTWFVSLSCCKEQPPAVTACFQRAADAWKARQAAAAAGKP